MNDEAPKVTLAGQPYPVPPIPFRDLSKIFPLLDGVLQEISARSFTEDTFDSLARIVYHGIRAGSPSLAYEAFLDLTMTVEEMIAAVPVICIQAGLKPKAPTQGEATGA